MLWGRALPGHQLYAAGETRHSDAMITSLLSQPYAFASHGRERTSIPGALPTRRLHRDVPPFLLSIFCASPHNLIFYEFPRRILVVRKDPKKIWFEPFDSNLRTLWNCKSYDVVDDFGGLMVRWHGIIWRPSRNRANDSSCISYEEVTWWQTDIECFENSETQHLQEAATQVNKLCFFHVFYCLIHSYSLFETFFASVGSMSVLTRLQIRLKEQPERNVALFLSAVVISVITNFVCARELGTISHLCHSTNDSFAKRMTFCHSLSPLLSELWKGIQAMV
jgi:hypothetical protein